MIGVKLGLHLGSNVPTLLHQALSAIRRNNGTLIGIPDNFAGAYIDSAGTQPVTAVGDVLGLLTDRMGVLGPELNLDPTFSDRASWSEGGADATHYSVVSGNTLRYVSGTTTPVFSVTAPTGVFPAGTYEVTVTCSQWTSGSVKLLDVVGGPVVVSGVGTVRQIVTIASATALAFVRNSANVDMTFTFAGVKRLTGNHATQPTTASKPIVAVNAQGKKVISFDGSDDFLKLSQPVFTAANDDGFVCAGVTPVTVAEIQAVVASRGPSATPTSCSNGLFMSSGAPLAYWEGDVSTSLTGSVVAAGTPIVISARKTGTAVSLRVNGAVVQSGTTSVSGATIANASVGVSLSGASNAPLLPGNERISAVVMCKGQVSDADAILIERWIGSLQGQTL